MICGRYSFRVWVTDSERLSSFFCRTRVDLRGLEVFFVLVAVVLRGRATLLAARLRFVPIEVVFAPDVLVLTLFSVLVIVFSLDFLRTPVFCGPFFSFSDLETVLDEVVPGFFAGAGFLEVFSSVAIVFVEAVDFCPIESPLCPIVAN